MEPNSKTDDLECVEPAKSQHNGAPDGDVSQAIGEAADLETALNEAMASERWLVAVWHISEGRLHLYREASDFPGADIEPAQRLLQEDLALLGQAIRS